MPYLGRSQLKKLKMVPRKGPNWTFWHWALSLDGAGQGLGRQEFKRRRAQFPLLNGFSGRASRGVSGARVEHV